MGRGYGRRECIGRSAFFFTSFSRSTHASSVLRAQPHAVRPSPVPSLRPRSTRRGISSSPIPHESTSTSRLALSRAIPTPAIQEYTCPELLFFAVENRDALPSRCRLWYVFLPLFFFADHFPYPHFVLALPRPHCALLRLRSHRANTPPSNVSSLRHNIWCTYGGGDASRWAVATASGNT